MNGQSVGLPDGSTNDSVKGSSKGLSKGVSVGPPDVFIDATTDGDCPFCQVWCNFPFLFFFKCHESTGISPAMDWFSKMHVLHLAVQSAPVAHCKQERKVLILMEQMIRSGTNSAAQTREESGTSLD